MIGPSGASTVVRVGFRAPPLAWQGGRNYLWNLLYAVGTLRDRKIEPVVVARIAEDVTDFSSIAEVIAPTVLSRREAFLAGRATRYLANIDVVERIAMARAGVHLCSHAPPLGKRFGRPWIYWIPDLQHRRLPKQFSRTRRVRADFDMRQGLEHSALVIVSSHAARSDVLEHFGAQYAHKLRVLQFVAQPRTIDPPPREDLSARYDLPSRYLYLPNQFWTHKNHAIVVDALERVRARDIVVVATGASGDFRNSDHFARLMDRARRAKVEQRFRVLGAVPFRDVIGLMTHAIGVINPSLFEGWSTTVEEARALGKRLILSSIDVHREQAPPRARYFDPHRADELAAAIEALWNESDEGDAEAARAATAALPVRTRSFADAYVQIVHEALSR
ncbi:MAG: glycosyltransferase family 4 protein [Kofleriaceae bacterium]